MVQRELELRGARTDQIPDTTTSSSSSSRPCAEVGWSTSDGAGGQILGAFVENFAD
jgi:hypothetical protein